MTSTRRSISRRKNRRFLGLLPPGAAPGVLREVPDAEETTVRVSSFNADFFEETEAKSLSELTSLWDAHRDTAKTWVDVMGLKDIETLRIVAEAFSLPGLAMEDVTSTHQRAKAEDYGDILYIVVRLPWDEEHEIRFEQVSIFIGPTFVVSFQETRPDAFAEVRNRLTQEGTRVRGRPIDFFGYALMDCVVDHYLPIVNTLEEKIDSLEDDVFSQSAHDVMPELLSIRRTLANLRRAAKPVQGALGLMLDAETSLFSTETRLYLRDTLDHINRVLDSLESGREVCASLMDVHLSVASQRLNEVMKVLTIISVTFIPLSFIAGLYGMNFDTKFKTNMPELSWPFGYAFALALMATSTVLFLGYFWRKGWLTNPKPASSISTPAAGAAATAPVTPTNGSSAAKT